MPIIYPASVFTGLHLARKALGTHQAAVQVAGHNLAALHADLAMLPRDAGYGDADIAFLLAADDEACPLHHDLVLTAIRLDRDKSDFHATRILSRDRPAA